MNAYGNFKLTAKSLSKMVAAIACGTGCFLVFQTQAAENPPPSPAPVAVAASASSPVDVLLRGPVHEAFLPRFQLEPQAGILVHQQPPEPIQEIPPELRPEGNVVWVPGYYGWDAVKEEFLWISGGWRVPPPGHRWVPGYWNRSDDGFRWISGFWLRAEQEEVQYFPPPPASQEREPGQPPPNDDTVWVPGCWEYRDRQYAWRPGYWAKGQENWVWVPRHYVHTPRGMVLVDGYWDARLESRGLLFAPVMVRSAADQRVALQFTPQVALDLARVSQHLFVQATTGQYLFGNYYGDVYADAGIQPWHVYSTATRVYDPLFTHANFLARRAGSDLLADLSRAHSTLLETVDLQPALTLVEQASRLANLPNSVDATQVALAHSLDALGNSTAKTTDRLLGTVGNLVKVTAKQQAAFETEIQQMVSLRTDRLRVEAQTAGDASADLIAPGVPTVLELPKVAQVPGVTDLPLAKPVPETLERVIEAAPLPSVPQLPVPRPRLPVPRLPVPRLPF